MSEHEMQIESKFSSTNEPATIDTETSGVPFVGWPEGLLCWLTEDSEEDAPALADSLPRGSNRQEWRAFLQEGLEWYWESGERTETRWEIEFWCDDGAPGEGRAGQPPRYTELYLSRCADYCIAGNSDALAARTTPYDCKCLSCGGGPGPGLIEEDAMVAQLLDWRDGRREGSGDTEGDRLMAREIWEWAHADSELSASAWDRRNLSAPDSWPSTGRAKDDPGTAKE
jgi:hypothetical protein